MILFDLCGNEAHPAYQSLHVDNHVRHLDFIRSATEAALDVERPFLSQTVIKALNFHAIACLHTNAGQYRPCDVGNEAGTKYPPFWQVPDLMDDFTNQVNRHWETTGPAELGAHVLWRLNAIHPFINGNGRTARAACFFAICLKAGGWLPYDPVLPVLIKEKNAEYIAALREADANGGDISKLAAFLKALLEGQVRST